MYKPNKNIESGCVVLSLKNVLVGSFVGPEPGALQMGKPL